MAQPNTTAGFVADPTDYVALIAGLRAARRESISDWAAFVHPHTPLEDSLWPTPTAVMHERRREIGYDEPGEAGRWTSFEFGPRLPPLPPAQRLICGLTAAELALERLPYHLPSPDSEPDTGTPDPRVLVERLRGVLDGATTLQGFVVDDLDYDPTECSFDGATVHPLAFGSPTGSAVMAAHAACWSFWVGRSPERNPMRWVAAACLFAARGSDAAFLREWWARCRCRLAMATPAAPVDGPAAAVAHSLSDPDSPWWMARRALEEMLLFRDRTVIPHLERVVESGSGARRRALAASLQPDHAATAKLLFRLAVDADADVRRAAAFSLKVAGRSDSGGGTYDGAMILLQTDDSDVRVGAVRLLDVIGDRRSRDAMAELQLSDDEAVRRTAAQGLLAHRDPRVDLSWLDLTAYGTG